MSQSPERFPNRVEAGRLLARHISERRAELELEMPIVISLPQGGVPVAREVAQELKSPIDVLVVQRIGMPESAEYGLGAVAEDGFYWINREVVDALGISDGQLEQIIQARLIEVQKLAQSLRQSRNLISVRGRDIILVDDGLSTGVTAGAAARALRRLGASRIIVAIPACNPESFDFLRHQAEEVICLQRSPNLIAVHLWYDEFPKLSQEHVTSLLEAARAGETDEPFSGPVRDREIEIECENAKLPGLLSIPHAPQGLVIFCGSAGTLMANVNQLELVRELNGVGFATLVLDLLTPPETLDRSLTFDIPLLAHRLKRATDWSVRWLSRHGLSDLPLGYYGIGTAASACFWAAADLKNRIVAIVSFEGRPDLARSRLSEIKAPTLLLANHLNYAIVELNEEAARELRRSKLELLYGNEAEPGSARNKFTIAWFGRNLGKSERTAA